MPEGPLGGPRPAASCSMLVGYFFELHEGEIDDLINTFTTVVVNESIEGEVLKNIRISSVSEIENQIVIEINRDDENIMFRDLKNEYKSILQRLNKGPKEGPEEWPEYELRRVIISEGEPHIIIDCEDPEGITGVSRPLADCFLNITQKYRLEGNFSDIERISDDIRDWIDNVAREGDIGIVSIDEDEDTVIINYSLSGGNLATDEIHMAYYTVGNAIRNHFRETDVFPLGEHKKPPIILECV